MRPGVAPAQLPAPVLCCPVRWCPLRVCQLPLVFTFSGFSARITQEDGGDANPSYISGPSLDTSAKCLTARSASGAPCAPLFVCRGALSLPLRACCHASPDSAEKERFSR